MTQTKSAGTEAKHTPGPWDIMEGRTLLHIETANKGDGSPCGTPICSLPKKAHSNASLISSAPDLLEACTRLLNTGLRGADDYRLCLIACSGDALDEESLRAADDFGEAVTFARAVVAKAKGGAL